MKLRLALLILVLAALLASGIAPYDRGVWWAEVVPVLIALPILLASAQRFPLTPLTYGLIAFFSLILILGGVYTYARVPVGFVVQDRFDRLVALQEQITEENLATFEGRDVEVMITGKLGKKDTDTHRVTGREKTGVLVHIGVPEGEPVPEIGDFVTATVTHAGRHNLLADPDVAAGQTYSVRH